ncbi:MAG TPA: Holliday junction resolvase RuvX [Candidatus Saccharimonadales bacterium]
MSSKAALLLCFDVGEKRVGVAKAVRSPGIAFAISTLNNDATITDELALLIQIEHPDRLVVGRPRNQAGEATKQTKWVEQWVKKHLAPLNLPISWQDESLTSVAAEEHLKRSKKKYSKGDIDAAAAAVILQDFIEEYWHATAK